MEISKQYDAYESWVICHNEGQFLSMEFADTLYITESEMPQFWAKKEDLLCTIKDISTWDGHSYTFDIEDEGPMDGWNIYSVICFISQTAERRSATKTKQGEKNAD